jgi:hypothetical protein
MDSSSAVLHNCQPLAIPLRSNSHLGKRMSICHLLQAARERAGGDAAAVGAGAEDLDDQDTFAAAAACT